MDTTYWGKSFGVMLFKDAKTKENLLKYYVKTETNILYKKGIEARKTIMNKINKETIYKQYESLLNRIVG